MFDIGFQALSRLLASGMNVKVFVLDTQVYSNTGGQASTSTFMGQNTKMSVHGKLHDGKQERPDRDDAPPDVRGPDNLRPCEPFLSVRYRRTGVRRPGDRLLLHHLPTR